jgi:hypothetical protein
VVDACRHEVSAEVRNGLIGMPEDPCCSSSFSACCLKLLSQKVYQIFIGYGAVNPEPVLFEGGLHRWVTELALPYCFCHCGYHVRGIAMRWTAKVNNQLSGLPPLFDPLWTYPAVTKEAVIDHLVRVSQKHQSASLREFAEQLPLHIVGVMEFIADNKLPPVGKQLLHSRLP